VAVGESVVVLEQQPLLIGGSSHQRERSFEFFAAQENAQLALLQFGPDARLRFGAIAERILRAFVGRVDAAIPDDHVAAAVFLRGNHALERGVVERMILGFDREALVAHLQRRALGNGPGFQHAVEFEAEVVVHAPRGVLLHDEEQRAGA
jgi:hypothetical protein